MTAPHLVRNSAGWQFQGKKAKNMGSGVDNLDSVNLLQLRRWALGNLRFIGSSAFNVSNGDNLFLYATMTGVPLNLPDDSSGDYVYTVRAEYAPYRYDHDYATSAATPATDVAHFVPAAGQTIYGLAKEGSVYPLRHNLPVTMARVRGQTTWYVMGPRALTIDARWKSPTLFTGFTESAPTVAPVTYRFDETNNVQLRGCIDVSVSTSNPQPIFAVTSLYRSTHQYWFPVLTYDGPTFDANATPALVLVHTDGSVNFASGNPASIQRIYLDGIRYPATL